MNPARAGDYAIELATVAEHMVPEALEAFVLAGASMSPRQLTEPVLAELDSLVPA